jgi:hypothetical protein
MACSSGIRIDSALSDLDLLLVIIFEKGSEIHLEEGDLTTLHALLGASPTPLTCRELIERWPGDAPRQDSLLRTLARGIELGLFTRTGHGTKSDPFRVGINSSESPTTNAPSNESCVK